MDRYILDAWDRCRIDTAHTIDITDLSTAEESDVLQFYFSILQKSGEAYAAVIIIKSRLSCTYVRYINFSGTHAWRFCPLNDTRARFTSNWENHRKNCKKFQPISRIEPQFNIFVTRNPLASFCLFLYSDVFLWILIVATLNIQNIIYHRYKHLIKM